MVEVREPQAGRVDQFADARHLVELDLRHLVGVRVVVGMQPVVKKITGMPARRVAVVIAARVDLLGIGGIVELVVETQRLLGGSRLAACASRSSSVLMRSDPTRYTVFASLALSSRLRPIMSMLSCATMRSRSTVGWSDEVERAPSSALFARVPHEQHRPLRPRPERERARHRHQRHRPRSVVVRAVPDAIGFRARRDASRRARAAGALGGGRRARLPRIRRGRSARRTPRRSASARIGRPRRWPTTFCVSCVRTTS